MIDFLEVEIHDRFQLEMILQYNLRKKSNSKIDFYFFIPKNLNINSLTYPKYLFYRNLKSYVRFSSKKIKISNLKGFVTEIERLEKIENPVIYEREIREFACCLEFVVRDYIKSLNSGEIKIDTKTFSSNLMYILSEFREKIVSENRFDRIGEIDEYISVLIQQKLLKNIRLHGEGYDQEILRLFFEIVEIEKNYFHGKYGEKKDFHYRQRLLKNYVHSSLFLKTQKKVDGKLYEQLAYGTAALFTMLIITIGSLFIDSSVITLKFLLITAVAYALKDRIKDLFKMVFYKGISRGVPDYLNTVSSAVEKLLTIKESYAIFTSQKLSRNIKEIFDRMFPLKSSEEDVIRYTLKAISNFQCESKRAVREIIYLDLKQFLHRMDDPEDLYYRYENGEILQERYHKEYRIKIVADIQNSSGGQYKCYEIFINRDGLLKINDL